MAASQKPSFPVDSDKLASILRMKQQQADNFPHFRILIVSYNASNKLIETIERIPTELLSVLDEVFVFDDFSVDDTFELGTQWLNRAKAQNSIWAKKLKVFKNSKNHGYGGNQKLGFQYAIDKGFDYVILLHGDGQYAPEFLVDLIWPVLFGNQKVVFGSRMLKPLNALKGGMPAYKFIGNRILTLFENLLLGLRLSEFHSGYRLYSTHVLRHLPFCSNTDDFHFDTQIIIQCHAFRVSICEVNIPTYYGDEICHVNGLKYAWNVFASVISYQLHRLHLLRKQEYLIEWPTKYELKQSPYSSHSVLLSFIQPGDWVLDIGCGRGLLAKKMGDRGAKVLGVDDIEPSEVEGRVVSFQRVNLDTDLSALKVERPLDKVVLGDVVEHIREPVVLLKRIYRSLGPGGKILISTGNIAIWFYRLSLLFGRFNYGPRGILDQTHVHLYTLASFKKLIENSGYRICKIRFTNLPFELVLGPIGKGKVGRVLDVVYSKLVRLWPALFAYQFVIEAEPERIRQLRSVNLVERELESSRQDEQLSA